MLTDVCPLTNSVITNPFLCPLSGVVMTDPVTNETGWSYQRAALEEYLRDHPECPYRVFYPNINLRKNIEKLMRDKPEWLSGVAPAGSGSC